MYATVSDSAEGRQEAGSMLEAAALGWATTFVIKPIVGRDRPNETADRGAWLEGGDSFPSGHVTAAFAIGTVLAESGSDDYRWVRRTLGYGIGVGTAYARVKHNAHWLSDTVAGAGLGMAAAHFVMNRRDGEASRAEVLLVPVDGGLMLTYSAPLTH